MNIWSILCLIWTLLAYIVAKRVYQKHPQLWLSPAISVPVLTILLMAIFGISYQTYAQDTQWIVNLLGPATVAFAVPIYRYRDTIRKNLGVLSIAIVVGMSVGVMSAYEMAKLFHFSPEVTNSLMARSISTPFAMILAEDIHGSAALVSLFTVITGLVGMICGDAILAITKIRSNVRKHQKRLVLQFFQIYFLAGCPSCISSQYHHQWVITQLDTVENLMIKRL